MANTGGDLVLTGVRKLYGPAVVLDLDQLVMRRGEVVGLVGENGAGKSTMMGVIAGSVTPNAGTVSISCTAKATPMATIGFTFRTCARVKS